MSTARVVAFIGRSGAGKTTLLEKVVRELTARGRHVATVKHHSHRGFEIDREGKDSWRMARAGSRHVVVAAPDKVAAYRTLERELGLAEIVAGIDDVDIVLVEGYRDSDVPHVEVVRGTPGFVGSPERRVAVVTDLALDVDVPVFDLDDVAGVVAFVEAMLPIQPHA